MNDFIFEINNNAPFIIVFPVWLVCHEIRYRTSDLSNSFSRFAGLRLVLGVSAYDLIKTKASNWIELATHWFGFRWWHLVCLSACPHVGQLPLISTGQRWLTLRSGCETTLWRGVDYPFRIIFLLNRTCQGASNYQKTLHCSCHSWIPPWRSETSSNARKHSTKADDRRMHQLKQQHTELGHCFDIGTLVCRCTHTTDSLARKQSIRPGIFFFINNE